MFGESFMFGECLCLVAQFLCLANLFYVWQFFDQFVTFDCATVQVLELHHDFTANELKRAYRRESLANHPDKGGSVEGFQRVAAAQATMADRNKLDDYDKGTCVDGGGGWWDSVVQLSVPNVIK